MDQTQGPSGGMPRLFTIPPPAPAHYEDAGPHSDSRRIRLYEALLASRIPRPPSWINCRLLRLITRYGLGAVFRLAIIKEEVPDEDNSFHSHDGALPVRLQ